MTTKIAPWFLVGLLAATGCARRDPTGAVRGPQPTRGEIWTAIQPLAARYRIEPAFVFALVIAESNGDPWARNGEARGLMQMKPRAWRMVSRASYEPKVWDWRANLEAGIDYLAYSRAYLHRQRGVVFSYPLLLAAFHYGIDYVEAQGFDASHMPVPDNAIYRELWRGNLAPVPAPIG